MNEYDKAVIRFLLSGWADALHSADSWKSVAQSLSDADEKYLQRLADPVRRAMIEMEIGKVRRIAQMALDGRSHEIAPELEELQDLQN